MSEGDYTESDDEGEEGYKNGGYHKVEIGEIYGGDKNQYLVQAKLGWGHFSTVWLVRDREQAAEYRALKIQKSASHYMEAAYDEVEMLEKVKEEKKNVKWSKWMKELVKKGMLPSIACKMEYTGVVTLYENFLINGPNGVHMAFVFETMGPNILALIKRYNFQGIPIKLVRKIATHLLVGLDYLHRFCGILHTDLKPENALVCCPLGVPVDKHGLPLLGDGGVVNGEVMGMDIFDHPEVLYKIVDLGNSCWVDRHFSDDIQTRQYRSPEVLLHAGYDKTADIWSLACMVFELVTGDYLFDPKGTEEFPRDEDHLALIMELLGNIPKGLIEKSRDKQKFYNRKFQLRHIKDLKRWPLKDVLMEKYNVEKSLASELSEFLLPMLVIDPSRRASAQDMLNHPFLLAAPAIVAAGENTPPRTAAVTLCTNI
jgi:serine/threonine-protein kinase SRPK3